MTAAVDSMFYVGEVPWHGLGEYFENPPETTKQAMIAAGLDREIGLKDLYTEDSVKVPNKLTYYTDDGTHLGVVGPRYVPLQNIELFSFFDPFLQSGMVDLHTAGSLHGGTKVWVLGQLNPRKFGPSEIVKGDEIRKFILLSNSHDGTTSIRIGFTPIRVICANTMAMAHRSEASKLIRVRHTVNAISNLESIRDTMNLANAEFEATAEQYRWLATRQFNENDLKKYIKIILGVEKVETNELKTNTKNIIEKIEHFIDDGLGKEFARGSWYSAYNGVSEWLNYSRGRNSDNRMNSLWFGQNEVTNRLAIETAVALAA
jgi:phage/plasmid-like protein (TIGR03299 family)